MGKKITYGELDRLSRDFAAYLQSVLKLPRGERIALMMPNILQYPVCMLGALRGGYVVVNFAIRSTKPANWSISSRIVARKPSSFWRIFPVR